MAKRLLGVGFIAALAAFSLAPAPLARQSGKIDFARDVQPILRQQCYECHGPAKQKKTPCAAARSRSSGGGTPRAAGCISA